VVVAAVEQVCAIFRRWQEQLLKTLRANTTAADAMGHKVTHTPPRISH
jgi:hypothetical protein